MNKTEQARKVRQELKKFLHTKTRFVENGTTHSLYIENERSITATILEQPKKLGFQLVAVDYSIREHKIYAIYIFVGDSK